MQQLPNITEILINTFNTLINQFIDFVPRLMGCFVILVVGYLVAKSVAVLVKKVLGRVGFDRIGEKLNEISIVKQLKTEIKLSEIIAKVLLPACANRSIFLRLSSLETSSLSFFLSSPSSVH